MSETNDVNDAIKHFPRLRARTLRFGCGAPRSAQTVGDGSPGSCAPTAPRIW